MGHRPEWRKEAEAETFDRTASNWYLGIKHYESRGSRVMWETRAQSQGVYVNVINDHRHKQFLGPNFSFKMNCREVGVGLGYCSFLTALKELHVVSAASTPSSFVSSNSQLPPALLSLKLIKHWSRQGGSLSSRISQMIFFSLSLCVYEFSFKSPIWVTRNTSWFMNEPINFSLSWPCWVVRSVF